MKLRFDSGRKRQLGNDILAATLEHHSHKLARWVKEHVAVLFVSEAPFTVEDII